MPLGEECNFFVAGKPLAGFCFMLADQQAEVLSCPLEIDLRSR
jgi:hypothetical protein